MYSYKKSIKSDVSDELINAYLIRPIAGVIVRVLYKTPVTPNLVTIASIVAGFIAALFYLGGTAENFLIAGLFVEFKDILDSADGQLARAKQQYTRIGRFLDSIGDFIVDIALFSAIGWVLYRLTGNWLMPVLAFSGLLCISLRVSYHVFYQVKFLHLQEQYEINRTSEEILDQDLKKGGLELFFQRIFLLIYGWQDRFIEKIDFWSAGSNFLNLKRTREECNINELSRRWYSDTASLRISGFLGFGTEFFLLMLCSVAGRPEIYLYLNILLMNGILALSIIYRRFILLKRLS